MAADLPLTAEELLQRVRSGKIKVTELSGPAGSLSEDELTKFMDLLLRWMNERKPLSRADFGARNL